MQTKTLGLMAPPVQTVQWVEREAARMGVDFFTLLEGLLAARTLCARMSGSQPRGPRALA